MRRGVAVEQWSAQARPCGDPDCGGVAEPEGDQELWYYVCDECGYEFGWEKVGTEIAEVGGCSRGISEDVRRAASAPMEAAMRRQEPGSPVFVQIGFGPPKE